MDIRNFILIEKKYDLYHAEINGICPWMYFRFTFWNYWVCRDLLGLSNNIQKETGLKSYIQQFKSVIGTIVRANAKHLCQADIMICPHPRRTKSDENYECIYTDWLAKRYCSNVVIEEPYENQHWPHTCEDRIYYTDLLRLKSALYGRILSYLKPHSYKKIYEEIEKCFEAPLKEIGRTYQYAIPYQKIYTQLSQIVFDIQLFKKSMQRILTKVKPRLIIEVVYYNKRCMVLNELGKEMGIPTVELQHGTMHASHAAYQFPPDCGEISHFPDYVFVFSEYWKSGVTLPIPPERIKVTGFPYFERQVQKYANTLTRDCKVTNILFVSQGTIGQALGRLASELCKILDADQYHIIYKLHPDECADWESKSPWLLQDNIEVVDNRRHTIYEYFSRCTIQVGVYSTAIYEGLGFGLTTYIYDIAHADIMAGLCEQGYAIKIKNALELQEYIISRKMIAHGTGRTFWAVNSEKNISDEIESLLKSAAGQ